MSGQTPNGLDRLRGTFGDETVTEAARRARVRSLFDGIAPRYDLMNDLMSFGLHRLWKRETASALAWATDEIDGPWIDLAGGTGDLAALLRRRDPDRKIVVADASEGMLAVARRRHRDMETMRVDAEALPFEDDSAAGVTLAFGLRNMTDPGRALRETARILRPGGMLALLEFSRVAAFFRPFYAAHSRLVIPLLGRLVAGDKASYDDLVQSIRIFPDADTVSAELRAAGLRVANVKTFMFGVAALHLAIKP